MTNYIKKLTQKKVISLSPVITWLTH